MTARVVIDDIAVEPVGGAIEAIGNAQRTWEERRGVLIRLRVGETIGVGEASPLPGYSADALAAVIAELGALPSPITLIQDPSGSFACEGRSLLAATARFALDSAALDLCGHLREAPARSLLAPLTSTPHDRLPLAGLLESEAQLDACRALAAVKIKIGRDLPTELSLIRAARALDIQVRVDANRSLTAGVLRPVLDELADLNVELIEEPADPELVAGVDSRVPIALDESLSQPGWERRAEALADRGMLGALVIKPALLGGIGPSRHAAARARDLGVAAIFSHLFGGPTELAMVAELALAFASPEPQGLAAHRGLNAFAPASLPQYRERGAIVPGPGPGLSLDVEPAPSLAAVGTHP